jgi:ABC-type transporter Mla subunit MlaD
MAIHDLTPRLRTRLGRLERWVGLFVALALVLLAAGFFGYLHRAAKRKGWFTPKVRYFTFVETASGLREGDAVKMMGFDIGRITVVKPMPPDPYFSEHGYNVYIEFEVTAPNDGYVWTDSRVRVGAADFLGSRFIEVAKGGASGSTNVQATYRWERGKVTGVWDDKAGEYVRVTKETKPYWLLADEAPALMSRLGDVVGLVEASLPGFFALTNRLEAFLTNATALAADLDQVAGEARPLVAGLAPVASNLVVITMHLKRPDGSLGEWLMPSNLNRQVERTLAGAEAAVAGANTNLAAVAFQLTEALESLATLTSNLNAQVQANTNILSELSRAVVHTDELVQGLQRHWFLRSAFKAPKTNAPPRKPVQTKGAGTLR